ncbi:MAG: UDP-N-acetylmuramoyl-L-alanine--D-glutamate ligase [Desulfuromonas sp.]|nr:UDP-N-acetylmuramoyl-L-alanine--D-glutamate ligase [Desulfuromonas sp.]
MLNLQGKHVVVAGAGLSGVAAATFCHRRGAHVVLSDVRAPAEIDLTRLDPGVTLDCGGHTRSVFEHADLVVVSPGIPLDVPILQQAARCGVKIVGEVELASWFIPAPLIAITGTNGKSTVTSLIGHILRHCGEKVFVGGNIGTPLIEAVDGDYAVVVVELSSFQLETVERFHASVAVMLNVSPDHLDRYPDMCSYKQAKKRIFNNQSANDLMVLNYDDAQVLAMTHKSQARPVLFSSNIRLETGFSVEHSERPCLVWCGCGEESKFDLAALQLKGIHNLENVMAAMAVCAHRGHDLNRIWEAACAFSGLPHRMELVRTLRGVCWYNDSKGTNIGSVEKSLCGLNGPVTLIAGGKDKGGDYALLRPLLEEKRPHLVLLGAAAQKMAAAWADICPVTMVASMEEAVQQAHLHTPAPGSVLLSPGCSSFDMFRSFTQRGEVYTALVMELE